MRSPLHAGALSLLLMVLLGPICSDADAATVCGHGARSPACHPTARHAHAASAQARHRGHLRRKAMTATAQPSHPPVPASLPVPVPIQAQSQTASDDLSGERQIPENIRKIMADPRIEPVIAYVLKQAARKPIGEWTVRQLQQIAAVISTLPETGMPMASIQSLYEYLGLDPNDVFNPQLGNNWQDSSTRFDRSAAAAVAAISSADCQVDPGEMTVALSRSCQTGDQ